MNSDSDDCLVVETKILSDKKWVETLEKEELDYFTKNQIPFEELEDRVVRCTACFKQGNHKQKVFYLNLGEVGTRKVLKANRNFKSKLGKVKKVVSNGNRTHKLLT